MDISDIRMGSKLELELFDENGSSNGNSLISEFEWLISDNEAAIAAPIYEGVIYPISIGTVMNVYFVHKKESLINLYRFRARVKGRDMSENVALLIINTESGIEKIQRRKYYRLEKSIQVKFRIVNTFSEYKNEGIKYTDTIAANLSGGGICLMLEGKIEVGKLVECKIITGQGREIGFFGKVIRYQKNDYESKFKYEAGIAYIKINNKDRETVVKYIFNEQRKLRKKGLI